MTTGRKVSFWLIGIGLFIVALVVLRSVLMPFVVGMAIAYFLDPVADKLEEKGLSRTLATAVLTIGFFAFAIILVLLLLPVLQSQFLGFAERLPGYIETLHTWLAPLTEKIQAALITADMEQLKNAVGDYGGMIVRWAGEVIKSLLSGGKAIVDVISLIFISPLVTFYMIRDYDRIVAKIDSWLPRNNAETIREQMRIIDDTMSGFLRGQATVCLILGAFYATCLSLIGLDFGLVVGIGAGIISFIPYFGAIVGFAVGMGIALAQFGDIMNIALVAAVFGIGQVLEGNFLTPKLVGEKIGLHPVWVIFALLAGGTLIGFTGVVIAIPVAAVIGVLVRFAIGRYLESPLYNPPQK
ncbi:MAG: AI-2E family transporter [Rhodospirillales bacterium]|nr:AI-2E family transporter [Rhodospirillales bacterium]